MENVAPNRNANTVNVELVRPNMTGLAMKEMYIGLTVAVRWENSLRNVATIIHVRKVTVVALNMSSKTPRRDVPVVVYAADVNRP